MPDSPIPKPCTCHVPCTCGSQAATIASLKAALEEAEGRNGELRAEVKGKTSKITQLSQLARKWERKHSHRENWIRALRGDRADLKVRLRAAEGERDALRAALDAVMDESRLIDRYAWVDSTCRILSAAGASCGVHSCPICRALNGEGT